RSHRHRRLRSSGQPASRDRFPPCEFYPGMPEQDFVQTSLKHKEEHKEKIGDISRTYGNQLGRRARARQSRCRIRVPRPLWLGDYGIVMVTTLFIPFPAMAWLKAGISAL